MPLVSVVLPVFNADQTVVRAIESILNQTWNELELIVINDGSTDGTNDVLRSIRDPRVEVFSTDHQGVCAAANFGVAQCNGEWIARMDADDFSYPTRIEKQFHHLINGNFDVVACQVRILREDDQPAATMRRYENWINCETLDPNQILALRFVEYPLVNPSLLAHRSYFELGYQENEFPEDYDLFLSAAEKGFRFGKVPEVLFDWYELSDGLTRTNPRYSVEAFDHCRKHHLLSGPLDDCPVVDLWGAGKTGKSWLKWLMAHSISVRRVFDVSPRKIGQNIHGCRVQSVDELEKLDDTPLLIGVGSEGARKLILDALASNEYRPGTDAWFVA